MCKLATTSHDEKLALLINAFNAFTLHPVAENRPIKSIRNIPARERWLAYDWSFNALG